MVERGGDEVAVADSQIWDVGAKLLNDRCRDEAAH